MTRTQSDNLPIGERFRASDLSGKIALVLATWFGSGLIPFASGTFGTLAAIPVILVLDNLQIGCRALFLIVVVGVAVWSSGLTQDLLKTEDPSEVVIDEVAGFLLATLFLPLSWLALGLVFFLFRFFDILKPYPINRLERLKGGFGIVMDDLLAGVYAYAGTWLILFFV